MGAGYLKADFEVADVPWANAAETPPTSAMQATASTGSSRFIRFSSSDSTGQSQPPRQSLPSDYTERNSPLKRLHTFAWASVPE